MRTIFNDTAIEHQFLTEGYVLIPFYNETSILDLKTKLTQFDPSDKFKGNQETPIGKQSFHITFFDSDVNYKIEIFRLVKDFFNDAAIKLLHDYKCTQGNVFLKPPHSGFVHPHQNLTICDETKYRTLSFWLPLQDTSQENGTVCLIPRSQNSLMKYRNTHILWPYTHFLSENENLHYFKEIKVKKGELLILDDRIVHYTPVNRTENERWVLHSLWAPQEAQIQFYDPIDDKVNIYNVTDDFWQYHTPGVYLKDRVPDYSIVNDEIILSKEDLIKELDIYSFKAK